jgi:hypothetical protein
VARGSLERRAHAPREEAALSGALCR